MHPRCLTNIGLHFSLTDYCTTFCLYPGVPEEKSEPVNSAHAMKLYQKNEFRESDGIYMRFNEKSREVLRQCPTTGLLDPQCERHHFYVRQL